MQDLTPEHPNDGMYHGNVVDDVAAGQSNLQVRLVSPEREVYSGLAHWVSAPGADGSFGVWPRHVSMVSALSSGMLRIGLPGKERLELLVRGAFLSVNANVVTILVDRTVSSADEIDAESVERDLADVNEHLASRLDDVEYTQYLDRREWCQAQLRYVAA